MVLTHRDEWMTAFYQQLNVYYPEQINEKAIARMHDIRLLYTNGYPHYSNAGTKTIYVNKQDSRKLQRYIFFHEFAHAYFHQDLNTLLDGDLWADYCENDAHLFAMYACLPSHMLELYDFTDDAIIIQLSKDFLAPIRVVEKRLQQIMMKGLM